MFLSEAIRKGAKLVALNPSGIAWGKSFPLCNYSDMACRGAGIRSSLADMQASWPWVFVGQLRSPCDCEIRDGADGTVFSIMGHLCMEHQKEWPPQRVADWVAGLEKEPEVLPCGHTTDEHPEGADCPPQFILDMTAEVYRRRNRKILKVWSTAMAKKTVGALFLWLRSSDGLIIVGIGLLVAGVMGFEPSQLWTEYYPELTQSYESVGVAVFGAMLATAGILKRLPRREHQ